jgi:hypothetical protein
MSGRFSLFQPVYADLGITAIPCSTSEKKPLVSHWQQMGIPASRQLASKFTDANALGIACGDRNKITVLDVDSTDRGVLKEAIDRHGEPRLIASTASGKYQAYYRHTGERRHIRPWGDGLPIDVLGGGLAIVPPSQATSKKNVKISQPSTFNENNRKAKNDGDTAPYGIWTCADAGSIQSAIPSHLAAPRMGLLTDAQENQR